MSKEIYRKAQLEWGKTAQLVAACEELAELTVEIAKEINGKRGTRPFLIDELADARIMIEQVEFMFGLSVLVENRKICKLEKLKKRLGM